MKKLDSKPNKESLEEEVKRLRKENAKQMKLNSMILLEKTLRLWNLMKM